MSSITCEYFSNSLKLIWIFCVEAGNMYSGFQTRSIKRSTTYIKGWFETLLRVDFTFKNFPDISHGSVHPSNYFFSLFHRFGAWGYKKPFSAKIPKLVKNEPKMEFVDFMLNLVIKFDWNYHYCCSNLQNLHIWEN